MGTYLLKFDQVPAFSEVLHNVKNNRPIDSHVRLEPWSVRTENGGDRETYVVPWHTRAFQHRNSPAHVVANILEVQDARVVVVLTRKEGARKIGRMCVCKRVILCVPATKTNVETADTRSVVVNDHDFLVVRPELDNICQLRN